MDKTWAGVRYGTNMVENEKEGWIALELIRHAAATPEPIIRVVWWDAEGQFSLEMRTKEIPLVIVEELIAEAKNTIRVR